MMERYRVAIAVTAGDTLPLPDGCVAVAIDSEPPTAAPELPRGEGSPSDLAYVIATSGSTGAPKGVMIDHRGALNTILDLNRRLGLGDEDRIFGLSSLGFDLSVYDLFGAFSAGAAVVIPDADDTRDPARWMEQLAQVSVWNSVPALMEMLLVHLRHRGERLPPSLRHVLLSGDWARVQLPDEIRAVGNAPQITVLGGATEASIWSIAYPVGRVDPAWPSIPYGKALDNQSMHVLNDRGEACPVGVRGELHIGGDGVALGYLGDEPETAARFSRDPESGERLYRTGDFGRYLGDGNLEILGREDHQIKLRGHRIELGEIEAALLSHPEVRECVVTPVLEAGRPLHLAARVVAAQKNASPPVEPLGLEITARAREWGGREAAHVSEDLRELSRRMQLVDELSTAQIGAAFAHAFPRPGERLTLSELERRLHVHPRHQRLLRSHVDALVSDGLLRAVDGGAFESSAQLPSHVPGERWEELERAAPSARELLRYIRQSGERVGELLRGTLDPLTLLFPDGSLDVAEALYRFNPVAAYVNGIAGAAVAGMVAAWPAERAIRVLEVGGGTGSTTESLLASLPPARTDYHFTDISLFFTGAAERRHRSRPWIRHGRYDINRPPCGQDVDGESYDLVVAANVLHDATDVAQALAHIRGLLSDGGHLMLIEATENARWQLTSVRFVEGLAVARADSAPGDAPFLDADHWCAALARAGFADMVTLPDGAAAAFGAHVLIARSPAAGQARGTPRRAQLEERVRAHARRLLPDYMVPARIRVVDRLPLTANGKVDRRAIAAAEELDAASPVTAADGPRTDLERKLADVFAGILRRERVGVGDNFFDLGGDSLLILELREQLRKSLGRDIPIVDLFRHPNVGALAGYLGGAADDSKAAVERRAELRRRAARSRRT
jgi:pyochelin synthetase